MDAVINDLPVDFILGPFLRMHKLEVGTMLLTEYDEVKHHELIYASGVRDGKEKGREEGLLSSLIGIMQKLKLSFEQAASVLSIPAEDYPKYREAIAKMLGMRETPWVRERRGDRDRAPADEGGMMYDANLSARDLRLHPTSECDGLRSVWQIEAPLCSGFVSEKSYDICIDKRIMPHCKAMRRIMRLFGAYRRNLPHMWVFGIHQGVRRDQMRHRACGFLGARRAPKSRRTGGKTHRTKVLP